jgi:hypothetical protein
LDLGFGTFAQKRPDKAEREWPGLIAQLGLGPEYFLAVYEAFPQAGWRAAENPAGYIKRVPGGGKRYFLDFSEQTAYSAALKGAVPVPCRRQAGE